MDSDVVAFDVMYWSSPLITFGKDIPYRIWKKLRQWSHAIRKKESQPNVRRITSFMHMYEKGCDRCSVEQELLSSRSRRVKDPKQPLTVKKQKYVERPVIKAKTHSISGSRGIYE